MSTDTPSRYETIMAHRARVADLSYEVSQDFYEFGDPGALLHHAAYLLAREAWVEQAHYLLGHCFDMLSVTAEDADRDTAPGTYLLREGANLPDYCQPSYPLPRVRALHLRVNARPEDRASIVAALKASGMVDGWDGAGDAFDDAFSPHGGVYVA